LTSIEVGLSEGASRKTSHMSVVPHTDSQPDGPKGRKGGVVVDVVLCLVGLVIAGAIMKAGLAGMRHDHELTITPDRPRRLGEFILTERSGCSVERSVLNKQFCVVSFVFTSCGSKCLSVSHQMEDIQRLTQGQTDVRLVSFTIDPRTDTPNVLAKFAATYHADTNRWLFLTGDRSVMMPLIEASFLPRAVPDDDRFSDLFLHTERIALLDTGGNVRAFFDGTRPDIAPAVVAELNKLRSTMAIR
jgi:protein SCO1